MAGHDRTSGSRLHRRPRRAALAVRPATVAHAQLWGPIALQIGRGDGSYFDRDHASACLGSGELRLSRAGVAELGGLSPDFARDEDRELNMRLWRAGKRGLYDDSIVVYAQVQPERLTRAITASAYAVTGRSHARLHYRDLIDRDGRLLDAAPPGRRLWGVPGFLDRSSGEHASAWGRSVARVDLDRAFYHECRMRYLTAYFTARWQEHWRARAAHIPILALSTGRRKRRGLGTRTPGVPSSRIIACRRRARAGYPAPALARARPMQGSRRRNPASPCRGDGLRGRSPSSAPQARL